MRTDKQAGFRPSTVFAVALALSIGWGVRGNFGHEFGAMLPGGLAAIAVCLMSGREDWRRRVAYFAFFGALGWGFGGSISYMQVISYTHSGQEASVLYGFMCLFVIGFLWGGMGGAGTAFPAVVDRERLQQVFAPLVWIFGVWWLWTMFGGTLLDRWLEGGDATWHRHLDPLYWFDTDWVAAFLALVAVAAYALCHESLKYVPIIVHAGAIVGFAAFFVQYYLGFHAMWFVPGAAAVGTLAAGVARNDYDRAMVLAGLIAGLATVAVLGAMTLEFGDGHWLAEGATAVALLGFVLWHKRLSAWAFAIGVPIALAISVWIAGRWGVDYESPVGVLAFVLLFALFASLLSIAPSRGHGLAVYAVIGALLGWILQAIGSALGIGRVIANASDRAFGLFGVSGPFPRLLGDTTLVARKAAGETLTEAQLAVIEKYGVNSPAYIDDLFTNWPTFFTYDSVVPWIGWGLGLIAGAAVFLLRYGRYSFGARLYTYMAVGWFVGFLIFPVLLGIRMTPPRSDSWAGTLGVLVGTLVFLFRSGLAPAVYASLVAAIIGGVGFSGAAFAKLMFGSIGNPRVISDPQTIERFAHYQRSNWHSFLEQTYGFINGVGIAVAMALLAQYVRPARTTGVARAWTGPFAVGFVLIFLVFVNWRKAVGTWVEQEAVPAVMKLFWFESVELTAQQWFAILFWIAGAAGIVLLARHVRVPLAFIPKTWLGRGQLLFLVFLWIVVIFNFERALTGFAPGRLITEGVVTVNAAIVTLILILFSRDRDPAAIAPRRTREVPYGAAIVLALLVMLGTSFVQAAVVNRVYANQEEGVNAFGGRAQYRFGPDAEWRIKPLLESEEHR